MSDNQHWIDKRAILTRKDLTELSEYTYSTERYHDTVEAMRRVVMMGDDLSPQEQALFYSNYKHEISKKRFSWKVLTEIIDRTEGCDKKAIAAIEYREQIEGEIRDLVEIVQKLIRDNLLPINTNMTSLVFYYNMLGDYSRYLCEIIPKEDTKERDEKIQATIDYYDKATFHAEKKLEITNHIRLGLVLNYAVFYKEIMNEIDRATGMINLASNEAISKIENFEDPQYKDTIIVLQYMRDTITLWLSDQDKLPEDPDKPKEDEEANKKEGKSDKSKKDKKSSSPKSKSGSPKKKT